MTESQPPIDGPLGWPLDPEGPTVCELLQAIHHPTPGWSEAHGGVDGVIAHAAVAQKALMELSARLAEVRSAAIRQQLRCESGVSIARRHGITGAAVSQAAKAPRIWKDETW